MRDLPASLLFVKFGNVENIEILYGPIPPPQKINKYIPGTQMTLVLIEKGLFGGGGGGGDLLGSIYIYIYMCQVAL